MNWGRASALTAALLGAIPAGAAVFEVGDDGALERLDAPVPAPTVTVPLPQRIASGNAAIRARQFQPDVTRAGREYEVSPALVDAIAHVESRYNPRALSPAKAAGIMQLMPATARAMGVDRMDPAANIRGGTAYLRVLLNRFDGDIVRTIAAYNAGPGAVIRAGGVPRYPETVAYVASVLDRLSAAAQ